MSKRLDTHRLYAAAGLIFFTVVSSACPALAADTKRVMLLHSFGRDVRPWSDYAQSIRSELQRQSPWPLDITDHSLISARSDDQDPETPFVEYLRALFTKRPLDLIVSIGAPAADFVQRHRQELFAATPMVFTVVDQRRVQYSILTANDAVVPIRINYVAAIENILRVLPDTKTVMVIVGTSPIEQFWRDEIRKDVMPFADRLTFTFSEDLSFEDLLKRAAAPPPHSVIFWELMIVDAAGVVHDGDAAFKRLHAAANVPIFGYYEANLGEGLVGGPYAAALDSSRQTAAAAIRVLGGEKAGDIRITPIEFATPRFDWREMQRWGISESQLPPGSTIYFRDPTPWDQYRAQILAIGAAILLQAALISWLLYERRRRHLAEATTRQTLSDLTRVNLMATAGELSASIAHEVNQPLTGIVSNANAGIRWLAAATPDLGRAEAAFKQIVAAGHHASDVIAGVRALFTKGGAGKRVKLNVNQLIQDAILLERRDIERHHVLPTLDLDESLPDFIGDRVQLLQVILNLNRNAIEAMSPDRAQTLRIKSELDESGDILVSVEDSGTGIDLQNIGHVFNPLFTTKPQGLGIGLSICRSIIESHAGRLWATSTVGQGSTFFIKLPSHMAGDGWQQVEKKS